MTLSKQNSLKALILGKPNVGKSTLMNSFIGEKLSIVSRKAQTTQQNITGISTDGLNQIVFVDTPGLNSINKKTNIKETFRSAAIEADLLIYVVDDRSNSRLFESGLLKQFDQFKFNVGKKVLVVNKIEKIEKEKLLEITKEIHKKIEFDETFYISLKKGYGTSDIFSWLRNQLKERNWEFKPNQKSNLSKEKFLCELTREQILNKFHEEIPYNVQIEVDYMCLGKQNSIKIYQTILLKKNSYKPIILGKQGKEIKNLSQRTRLEMGKFLKKKVHLFLKLKVI